MILFFCVPYSVNGKNSNIQSNNQLNGSYSTGYNKRNQKNYSNPSSTGSSNPTSRHGSFSKPYYSNEFAMYRNMMAYVPIVPPQSDESSQVVRRRGGSLPIPMMMTGLNPQQQQYYPYHRNSMYLSPNSPPNANGADIRTRPKSNSYCEGTTVDGRRNSNGMSQWLQRRHESSRSSEGNVVMNGVIRQPRGPDGTKGFHAGHRQINNLNEEVLA